MGGVQWWDVAGHRGTGTMPHSAVPSAPGQSLRSSAAHLAAENPGSPCLPLHPTLRSACSISFGEFCTALRLVAFRKRCSLEQVRAAGCAGAAAGGMDACAAACDV
jgi:hypothetical protein